MLVRAIDPANFVVVKIDGEWHRFEFWSWREVKIRRSLMQNGELTEKALDDRKLFRCPCCWLIVPHDFGCDVGFPEFEQLRDQAALFQSLGHPVPDILRKAIGDHRALSLWCDLCWAEVTSVKPLDSATEIVLNAA